MQEIEAGLRSLMPGLLNMIAGDRTDERQNEADNRFRDTGDHRFYAVTDHHDGSRLHYFEKTSLV